MDAKARVVAQYKNIYKVITAENKEIYAQITGKLRYETDEISYYPAVGDYVLTKSDICENLPEKIHSYK